MSIRSTLLIIAIVLQAALAARADTHAFFAERIWLGSGNVVQQGVLLVRDGVIVRVGARAEVAIPGDAQRHELGGRVIIPGLIVAHTSLGVAQDDENALTPQVRAVDGFDLFEDYSRYLAGGVTTIQISPGRQRLAPGQGAVVKLAGDVQRRVLAAEESLRIDLSESSRNPPRVFQPPVGAVSEDRPFEPTRPQLSPTLAGAAAGLRALFAAARDATEELREADPRLAAMAPYVANRRSLRVTAETAPEIQVALALSSEFSMPLVLVDPKHLEPFLDRLPALNSRLAGVVLNAPLRPGRVGSPEVPSPDQAAPRPIWEYAAELGQKGLADLLCIRPSADEDLGDMLFLGGLFTRSGATPAQALKMLTSNPAQLLGVEERVGSLASGRDADFVVLSGDPFDAQTRVLATYVDGQRVFGTTPDEDSLVLQAATILAGSGRAYRNGSLVIGGGKIRDVGTDVSTPPSARIQQFPGAVITPGLIDLSTGLGLGGELSGSVPLQTRLGEQLTGDDPAIPFARQGGVTTVLLAGSGSPAPMTAFKLADQPVVLADPAALRFSVGNNLTDSIASLKRTLQAGKAYADSWTSYEEKMREYQEKLKTYEAELAKHQAEQEKKKAEAEAAGQGDGQKQAPDSAPTTGKSEAESDAKPKPEAAQKPADGQGSSSPSSDKPSEGDQPPKPDQPGEQAADKAAPQKPEEPKKPSTNEALEPYRPLFAKSIPAFVQVGDVKAAEAAMELFAKESQLKTILLADSDLERVAEAMRKENVGAVLGPTLVRNRDGVVINLPQELDNQQVEFGFQSQARAGVRDLPLVVQYAVSKGLGPGAALASLTSRPAAILGLQDRMGALAVGQDADLVVWSGPPFDISSEVLAVMIDGRWVYQKGTPE